MNTFNHIYTKKIYLNPKKSQIEKFDFWLRKCCYLYNIGLQEKIEYYRISGKYLNLYEQKKELVDIKKFDSSFCDVPNKSLQEIIFRIDKSFKKFFSGGGFPKYKRNLNSIEFVKTDIRLKNNELYFPKIKEPIKTSENIELGWTSGRLVKEGNRFYIVLVYKKEVNLDSKNEDVLGVDLGLKDLYTDSNGDKGKRFSTKLVKKYRKRIDILTKSLSSKKRGSNRFKKVKKQLHKTHKRLNNTKMDYLHKTSTSLLKRSNESIISVGDINIESIINKNRKIKSKKGLVESFYSSSLGIFKQMISYKGIKFNKEIILVDERNTSKTCSCCGNLKHELTLSDRVYNCLVCKNSIDRDENAAINMKMLGLSHLSNKCVLS